MAKADFRVVALQVMWLLTHKRPFLIEFAEKMRPEYFGNVGERFLVRWAISHFNENDEVISENAIEQLLEENEDELEQWGVSDKDIWTLYDNLESVRPSEKKYVWNQAERFCEHQAINLFQRQLKKALEDDGLEAAQEVLRQAPTLGIGTSADGIQGVNLLSNVNRVLEEIGEEAAAVDHVPTGMPKLDSIMEGGLLPGEVACFIAPTGRGKTMWLSYLAARAVTMGQDVVYYTLEVAYKEIWLRVMASASGSRINDLRSYARATADPEFARLRKAKNSPAEMLEKLYTRQRRTGSADREVVIRDIVTRGATLNTIVADLDRLADTGFRPQLIIIDYADRLRPAGRYERRYEGQEEVFQELQALAKERSAAIWTASQAGRAGLRTAQLTLDFIQGAFSKTFECSYVLAAGQDKQMAQRSNEEFLFLMAKARRGGGAGAKFFVKYDLSRTRFMSTARRLPEGEEDLSDDYAEAMSYERDEEEDGDDEDEDSKSKYEEPVESV